MTHIHTGIEVRGSSGMVIDRPKGSGDYVFVHFLEPVSLQPGGPLVVKADMCMLYSPDCPTYIRAGEAGIFNNYLHVSPDLIKGVLHQYAIPVNQVFLLRTSDFVVPLLTKIQREWLQQYQYWEDAVRFCLLELLLHLSRHLDAGGAPVVSRHDRVLKEVRFKVHTAPHLPWTVAEMAALAGLGKSRFSALYTQLFGSSPMADLIRQRIDLAKFYLSNYPMSVSEVAARCGFVDLAYFSRYFRKYAGCPPSRFGRESLPATPLPDGAPEHGDDPLPSAVSKSTSLSC